jgi:hypothetical protein
VRTPIPKVTGESDPGRSAGGANRLEGLPGNARGFGDGSSRAPTHRIDRESILDRYRGRGKSEDGPSIRGRGPSGGNLEPVRPRELPGRTDPVRAKPPIQGDRGGLGPSTGRRATPPRIDSGGGRGAEPKAPLGRTGRDGDVARSKTRREEAQITSARRLDRLRLKDPTTAVQVLNKGTRVSVATDAAVRTAISVGLNVGCGWNSGAGCFWDPFHSWNHHCGPFWNWWWSPGCSWWWSSCCVPWWGFGSGVGFWGHGWGFWYSPSCWSNAWYAPYPVYYASVIYDGYQPPIHETIYVEQPAPAAAEQSASAPAYEGEGTIEVGSGAGMPGIHGRSGAQDAASQHLSVGDAAFREGRYSDAVREYAKAVELEPGQGVLHLILSDALFATGDYHYAAYALRRALELDPTLVDSVIDKHSFYGDPAEFDRQLELLERYLEDHFLDDDARLLLAANYLFAVKPAQASALLSSSFSTAMRESATGRLLFARTERLLKEPAPQTESPR